MKNKVNKNHPFFDRFEQLMAEKEKKGLGIRVVAWMPLPEPLEEEK